MWGEGWGDGDGWTNKPHEALTSIGYGLVILEIDPIALGETVRRPRVWILVGDLNCVSQAGCAVVVAYVLRGILILS